MAHNDFRKEPGLDRLRNIWFENKGNWLLATGVLVSLLTWAIGYFDLMPEITAVRRSNVPSLLSTGGTLVVDIVGCESGEGHVMAMLYTAENFTSDSVALRMETLDIENHQALWPIHNLQFGTYLVMAFHDVNGDERFSPESERRGFSRRPDGLDPLVFQDRSPGVIQAAFQFNQDKQRVIVELQAAD